MAAVLYLVAHACFDGQCKTAHDVLVRRAWSRCWTVLCAAARDCTAAPKLTWRLLSM